MRPILTLTAILTLLPATAAIVSPTQALQRLGRLQKSAVYKTQATGNATEHRAVMPMSVKDAALSCTLSDTATNEPLLYAYNNTTTPGGWLLLPADDIAPPLLGYSDTGTFAAGNIAPGLQYLIENYQAEIRAARQRRIPTPEWPPGFGRPNREAISPLVEARWNQDAPYNNHCPVDADGRNSVTGCVATAMAQIMHYHQWPERGRGIPDYYARRLQQQLTLNLPSIPFDWTNMLTEYKSGEYESQHADAVASLMNAVGHACRMDYSSSSSGAGSLDNARAFVHHMDYDESLDYVRRNHYTLREWEDLIYDNLRRYGPVQIAGYNQGGGHSFVCDGLMMNAMFHINWGWGGSSDGYFLLSALNPESQGIGGSAAGYAINEEAIINIRRPVEPITYYTHINCMGKYIKATAWTGDNEIGLSGVIGNDGREDFFGKFFFESENIATGERRILRTQNLSTQGLAMGYGYGVMYISTAGLAPGDYRLKAYYQNNGQPERQPIRFSSMQAQYALFTMGADGRISSAVVPMRDDVRVTSTDYNTPLYSGRSYSLTVRVNSAGNDVNYGFLTPCLYQRDTGNAPAAGHDEEIVSTNANDFLLSDVGYTRVATLGSMTCDVYPGENTYDFSGSLPSTVTPGQYFLRWEHVVGQSVNGDTVHVPAGEMSAVNVLADPGDAGTISGSFLILNSSRVNRNDIRVKYTLNNSSGLYDKPVKFWIFPYDGVYSIAGFSTPNIFVQGGDSRVDTMRIQWPEGEVGQQYFGQVSYRNASGGWTRLGPSQLFTVTATTTALDDLETPSDCVTLWPIPAETTLNVSAHDIIDAIGIYSLDGRVAYTIRPQDDNDIVSLDVDHLPAGVYVARISTLDGNITARRFVKK